MNKPKFEFLNYMQETEIAGIPFTVDCSSRTGDYLKAMSEEIRELTDAVARDEADADAVVNLGTEIINHVLGGDAADRIFGDRERDASDVLDILTFITFTVAEFAGERARIIREMVSGE